MSEPRSGLVPGPDRSSPRSDVVQSAFAYVIAVSSSAAALALSLALAPRIGGSAFVPLFAAVMVSAWYGGLGPGLVATALGGLAIDYYFEAPLYSLRIISIPTALRLGVFVLVALFISSLSVRMRSARAAAEAARREAEGAAAIVASSQDAIVAVDLGGRITEWNPGAAELFGREAAEAIGQSIEILQPHDRPTELARVVERLLSGERFGAYQTVGVRRDGRRLDLAITVSPLRGPGGELTGASLIGRDVTARTQLEQLRASLAAIVSSSDDAIFTTTLDGAITSWNVGAEQLYGYRPDEVLGRGRELLVPPERRAELSRLMEQLRRGERVHHLRTQRQRKDGRPIDVEITITPTKDGLGVVTGAATVTRAVGGQAPAGELAELARALAREPDAGRQLGAVVEALRGQLGADSASALRWDAGRGVLVPVRSSPPTSDTSETRPGEGAAGRAVQDRTAVLMNDYPSQRGATEAGVRAGTRAALAAPVMLRGRLVGVLVAGSRAAEARYTAADLDLIDLLAGLAAPVLGADERTN
jgi:PAS domain S-box-containing protein